MSRPSQSMNAPVTPTIAESTTVTRDRTVDVDGLKLFYREAGAHPTCKLLRAGAEFVGKQRHLLMPGISAQSAGARRIHLQLIRIGPGAKSHAHKHAEHETALYVLSGESGMWYGEKLEQHLVARTGDFLYIPANMPHLPYNRSDSESCLAVVARTDPNEQESVILLPDLETAHELLVLTAPR